MRALKQMKPLHCSNTKTSPLFWYWKTSAVLTDYSQNQDITGLSLTCSALSRTGLTQPKSLHPVITLCMYSRDYCNPVITLCMYSRNYCNPVITLCMYSRNYCNPVITLCMYSRNYCNPVITLCMYCRNYCTLSLHSARTVVITATTLSWHSACTVVTTATLSLHHYTLHLQS